jgi:hypothetical protein
MTLDIGLSGCGLRSRAAGTRSEWSCAELIGACLGAAKQIFNFQRLRPVQRHHRAGAASRSGRLLDRCTRLGRQERYVDEVATAPSASKPRWLVATRFSTLLSPSAARVEAGTSRYFLALAQKGLAKMRAPRGRRSGCSGDQVHQSEL